MGKQILSLVVLIEKPDIQAFELVRQAGIRARSLHALLLSIAQIGSTENPVHCKRCTPSAFGCSAPDPTLCNPDVYRATAAFSEHENPDEPL